MKLTATIILSAMCLALLPGCVLKQHSALESGRDSGQRSVYDWQQADCIPPLPSLEDLAQSELLEGMTARVVSVKDIGSPSLMYIIEFERVDDEGPPNIVRCLTDGGNPIFLEIGGDERWWWSFVYESGKNRSNKTLEIIYAPADTKYHGHFDCMQLVAWKMVRNR